MDLQEDFPLFPLALVALPTELIPLHIFEERYKAMVAHCIERKGEFGIVWEDEEGLRAIGCACEISEILKRHEDGKIDLIARGTRAFRLQERTGDIPYPAGTVEFLSDRPGEIIDPQLREAAHAAYADLVEEATDRQPEPGEFDEMTAYEMAATVDFGLAAKQGLLDLRSEMARLKLVTRLFRAAIKRLEVVEQVQERAKSNGKVRFGD